MRIIEADTCARAALNQDLMSRIDEFTNARGHQAHAVFMNFDLFGYADFHKSLRTGLQGWQGYSPGSRETIHRTIVRQYRVILARADAAKATPAVFEARSMTCAPGTAALRTGCRAMPRRAAGS